ncbi:MAG: (2Fe-2S) ferredoxin domain-containing protein [Deltaproteobacteria bacterium]|nr:(2Fe-2S) ferredoxin domain-containing protein [Deltaproteobacteria bacterium]
MSDATPVKPPVKPYEAHLFICTNRREKGECCASKGSAELRDKLKALVKSAHPEWKGRVRVNASGCLGHCEQGITAVLYPEGKWLTGLQATDLAVLEKELSRALDRK